MSLTQRLDGQIEPHDLSWREATLEDKRWFYDEAGKVMLARLRTQLLRGVGANGRRFKPRIQAVLADGSDGPAMSPHYEDSRAITLAAYRASSRGLTLYWKPGKNHPRAINPVGSRSFGGKRKHRGKGEKAVGFDEILEYHARGLVPRAPVRDVRLSAASIQQIKIEMRRKWEARNGSRKAKAPESSDLPTPAPAFRPELFYEPPELPVAAKRSGATKAPSYQPPAVPLPKIAVVGNTNFSSFTFGIGGGKELAERATEAGQFTGFRKLGPKPKRGKPPGGGVPLPTFTPSLPPALVVPIAARPTKPVPLPLF